MRRFPFIWRKTAEDETSIWKAEDGRQRKRAERAARIAKTEVSARRSIAALYADLCDSHGLPVPADPANPGRQQAKQARKAADRIARLQKAVTRARTEAAGEKRRADRLQTGLDDALGLNTGAVAMGASWQERRQQRMTFDKPTAEEATA